VVDDLEGQREGGIALDDRQGREIEGKNKGGKLVGEGKGR